MRLTLVLAALLWPVVSPLARAQESYGLPLRGEEAEAFLRTARVVSSKGLGEGITASERLTLNDGHATHKAVWKTYDKFRHGVSTFDRAGMMVDYEDSYRFEIAAYELDKLLGLDLVPPTVERAIAGKTGSLQLWVERAMTEADRRKKGLVPPDLEAWNAQIHAVRLLHQLTFDWDSQNARNLLIDPSYRVYAIDFSRSFAPYDQLRSEKALERFPRAGLEAIRRLDEATLQAKIGRWVTNRQIRGLLKRRDRIVELAAERVAEKGEAAVLY